MGSGDGAWFAVRWGDEVCLGLVLSWKLLDVGNRV